MANDLKDVMIALHPPSLDHCKEVVDAWFPDGDLCSCTYRGFYRHGLFGDVGPLQELFDPNSPNYSVEAEDWET